MVDVIIQSLFPKTFLEDLVIQKLIYPRLIPFVPFLFSLALNRRSIGHDGIKQNGNNPITGGDNDRRKGVTGIFKRKIFWTEPSICLGDLFLAPVHPILALALIRREAIKDEPDYLFFFFLGKT